MSSIIQSKYMRHKFKDIQLIGKGGEGNVYKATRKADGKLMAVKVCRNKAFKEPRNEMLVLKGLKHDAILKMFEVTMTRDKTFMQMEYLSGPDLCTRVIETFRSKGTNAFTENYVAEVMRGLIAPVEYLHSKNIVHRDLKPENYVLRDPKDERSVVLIDFGMALNLNDASDNIPAGYGTLMYRPPESIRKYRRKQDMKKGDVYALGVICFCLLTGREPINTHRDRDEVKEDIKRGRVNWAYLKKRVSKDTMHFVQQMMIKDTSARLSCKGALEHGWTNGQAPRVPTFSLQQLESMVKKKKIAKAIQLIFKEINPSKVNADASLKGLSMNEHFDMMDASNTGSISIDDIKEYLHHTGYSTTLIEKHANEILDTYDLSQNGSLDREEFSNLYYRINMCRNDRLTHYVFDLLDKNNSSVLELKELSKLFGEDTAKQIFSVFDLDHDGVITFQEFHACINADKVEVRGLDSILKNFVNGMSNVTEVSQIDSDDEEE